MAAPKRTLVIIAFAALYVIWGSTYLQDQFRYRNDSAVSDGWHAIPVGGRNHVRDRVVAGRVQIELGELARIADRRRVSAACWQWRCYNFEQYIDTGLAALIVAIVPIYIVILGWATGITPRPLPIIWLGLVGGFAGVGVLLGPALRLPANGGRHPAIGMFILLVSSFVWSAGSLYSRTAKHAPSPFLTAAQQMLCGGVLLLLAGILTGELRSFHPQSISMLSLASFIYLVIIGAVVGYTAYIWLLRPL